MHACSWMNGNTKYHQGGQTSQVNPQLIGDMTKIQSAEAASQYMHVSTGVSPPGALLTGHGGGYFSRVTSNWQTSTVPQQALSSPQAATGDNSCHSNSVIGSKALQSPFTNWQNGNHILPEKFICAPGGQKSFQQNHTRSPPNVTIQSQPLPGYGNWPEMRQDGNSMADFQHLQCQNLNEESAQSLPASASTVSTTAHDSQAAQNKNYNIGYRQINTQNGLSRAKALPSYYAAVFQTWRNKSIAANAESGQRISSMAQKTCNSGRLTNYSNFEINRFLSKTDQQPSKASIGSAAGTGEHLLSQQRIHRIADGNFQSPNVTEGRMTDYRTVHPLPPTNHVTVQQNLEPTPQQRSVPKGLCGAVAGDGGGNGLTDKAIVFGSNSTQYGYLTYNELSHVPQLSEGSSPLSCVMVPERVSFKPNDSSIHASPSRSGQRAVAVVQPLSQETCQTARKHVTSDDVNALCKRIRTEDFVRMKEKLSQYIASQVAHMKKKRNAVNIKIPSPDSAGFEHSSPKKSCADDAASKLTSNIQSDHCAEPPAPQSVTTSHPNSSFELSSIPTISWTMDRLTKLVKETSKAQRSSKNDNDDGNDFDIANKLLDMFWNCSSKDLLSWLKTGWYRGLIEDVNEFCSKHQTKSDTVVLLQVKQRLLFQVNRFHIIKHDDVYQEVPYTSSWLNINEQLDDIDKEFGFPWSLKYCNQTVDSDSQPELIEKANDITVQFVNDKQNVLPQTELEAGEPDDEKQKSGVLDTSVQPPSPTSGVVDTPAQTPSPTSGVVDTPAQTPSPTSGVVDTPIQTPSANQVESTGFSDPEYSFKIQILTPEEAKLIFAQQKIPQSTKTEIRQPDKLMNGSVEDEIPEILDGTSIKQFCCIKRWKEIISGSNKSSSCKCQCKQGKGLNDCTVKKLDHTEKPEEEENVSEHECSFHSTFENKKPDETMIFCWPEESPTHTEILDLSEDDDIPQTNDDMEPMNVSLQSDKSSTVVICDDNLFSSEMQCQMSDIEDSEQAQQKSTEMSQSNRSTSCDSEEFSNSVCGTQTSVQVGLTSTDSADTPFKIEQVQTQIKERDGTFESNCTSSETCKVGHIVSSPLKLGNIHSSAVKMALRLNGKSVGKKRRLSGPDGSFPSHKNLGKCKSSGVPDSQLALKDNSNPRKVVADPVRFVQLSLFGSAPLKKQVSISGHKSHMSLKRTDHAPETLTVKLSPLRRSPPETVLTGKYSIKQLIREKWERSIPPTIITYPSKCLKRKSKSQIGLKKVDTVGPSKTVELPVSFKKRKRTVTEERKGTKQSLHSLHKRWSVSTVSKHRVQVTKTDATVKQSDNKEGSHAENGSNDVLPLQENNVLRFSVLPNTFNFKDEAIKRHENTDNPELLEAKDKSPNTEVKTPTGAWTQNPEKKYCPLKKNSGLFIEFQKKYKEMAQPVTDN